ncbi:MAG TPA: DUF3787 domain-containing protein [Tissierellaceae bacterium]|nr:DUF3787 domain-containing protein [Tissierellaceae bacterium]
MDKKKRTLEGEKNKSATGSYKMYKDSKIENTQTDIYYNTEMKIEDSQVAIPTEDAVEEAKEWVDDVNKM